MPALQVTNAQTTMFGTKICPNSKFRFICQTSRGLFKHFRRRRDDAARRKEAGLAPADDHPCHVCLQCKRTFRTEKEVAQHVAEAGESNVFRPTPTPHPQN